MSGHRSIAAVTPLAATPVLKWKWSPTCGLLTPALNRSVRYTPIRPSLLSRSISPNPVCAFQYTRSPDARDVIAQPMLPFLLLILPDQDRAEPSFGSMHAMRDRSAAADPRIRRKYLDISIRHGCAAVSVPAWRLSHTDGPPRGFPESGDLHPIPAPCRPGSVSRWSQSRAHARRSASGVNRRPRDSLLC